jgi:hypothetical protein
MQAQSDNGETLAWWTSIPWAHLCASRSQRLEKDQRYKKKMEEGGKREKNTEGREGKRERETQMEGVTSGRKQAPYSEIQNERERSFQLSKESKEMDLSLATS